MKVLNLNLRVQHVGTDNHQIIVVIFEIKRMKMCHVTLGTVA